MVVIVAKSWRKTGNKKSNGSRAEKAKQKHNTLRKFGTITELYCVVVYNKNANRVVGGGSGKVEWVTAEFVGESGS